MSSRCFLFGGRRMPTELNRDQLFSFANSHRDEYESLLREFVETPTVSCDPAHAPDIQKGVELTVETIKKYGGNAEIHRARQGNPVVHGVFDLDKNLPTVTVYNHIDVQPASKETEPWDTEPFVFSKDGDRYLGRGTTDDKGPALTALFGIRAAREAGVRANMHLIWEREEEIGSPSFDGAMKKYAEQLATNSVLVSDTIWVSRERPACPAGLRGLQGFELTLETAKTDQHSGVVGGAARNPIGELMKLVSKMYNATTGKVKIKGFYDDVVQPSKKELNDFRNSGFTVKKFKKDHGFKSIRTEDPIEVMKRVWAWPTMEIHGLVGGYTGAGIKTIVPPRATVKISCRLVQNQDPKKIMKLIRAFVKKHNPDVKVVTEASMLPYKAPTSGPLAGAVRSAMKFAFGRDPVFVREGGSIGAVVSMEKILNVPVLFLGLSLPEHGYHAPNENYDWQQASGGMVAFAKYFEEIANL